VASRQFVYKISAVVRVVDADTIWASVDCGFRQSLLVNIRLLGYDAPEKNKGSVHERNQAKVAQAFTERALSGLGQLWVRTEKDPDDFGRWLGDIWVEEFDGTERHLGPALADEGLASAWPLRWHQVFDQDRP
jgi:endonuclease YncB( thermonuclease family)